jgi:hypothetical protein
MLGIMPKVMEINHLMIKERKVFVVTIFIIMLILACVCILCVIEREQRIEMEKQLTFSQERNVEQQLKIIELTAELETKKVKSDYVRDLEYAVRLQMDIMEQILDDFNKELWRRAIQRPEKFE